MLVKTAVQNVIAALEELGLCARLNEFSEEIEYWWHEERRNFDDHLIAEVIMRIQNLYYGWTISER